MPSKSPAACGETCKLIRNARNEFGEDRDRHWTRKRVSAEIKRRQRRGETLSFRKVPQPLRDAALRLFGTWQAAIKKVGLDYDKIRLLRQWSREKTIAMIRQLASDNVPLYRKHIEEHYPHLYRAAIRRFPTSWNKALKATGFDPGEHAVPRLSDQWCFLHRLEKKGDSAN